MRPLALLLAISASPVTAHELWLEPLDYTVNADAMLMAQILNGEGYSGQKLPFLPQRAALFEYTVHGETNQITARIGDIPAIKIINPIDGLYVLAYQAKNAVVTYADWDTFVQFTEHKDLANILKRHSDRGLAEEAVTEVYSRYSKSLVAVGGAQGEDNRKGLLTEIVALNNPYVDDLTSGMNFQVWFNDQPRAEAQFEVYDRAPDGTVSQTFFRTNDEGIVTVPVKPSHTYMADAVVMREPSSALAAETGAVWETLWANMTWAIPASQ